MKIEDYLFLETDDACALCGQRGRENLTIHHIDEVSTNNEYDNQIVLCHNCHHRFHQKKGIDDEERIKNRKFHLIVKTITQYGVSALKIAYRNNFGVIAMPFLLYHLVDLGFMSKEEDQMGYGEQNDATSRFAITDKGKNLYKKWFLNKCTSFFGFGYYLIYCLIFYIKHLIHTKDTSNYHKQK